MLNIAHRGASAYTPENTLPAFEQALELGVDMIELDVHMSRDGELVVIHDATLERTTNGRGRIREKDLYQLKALDAGSWFSPLFSGIKIPTLREVLDLAKGKVQLDIEVKRRGIEERVVNLLRDYSFFDQVLITSFDHKALLRIKKLEPSIRTGALLAMRPKDMVATARRAKSDILCIEHSLMREGDIKACHREGVSLYLWTVNDPRRMEHLIDLGVDGIITDYPDVLRRTLSLQASFHVRR